MLRINSIFRLLQAGDTDAPNVPAMQQLVVHHSGKYEANEAGRSSLFCTALDAEFYVKREGEQIAFSLTCTKIDEAEEPKLRTYSLQPEKLFIDEEGETIHSLTVQDVARNID